ncbi:hypothetical protein [Phyllobacterium endophyticum]|uniref:Uncharacterized protein n=1 Tax=Phyllobacterium endophyticum TaxID=1149773 RepID=A0A2P7AQX9_9HYPH|nr:hypothetical protein [Phyllobacterium endophyticum]MBB3237018.1 hypothetical protein [Phyllobacterium endophyticum]PSH56590.1 hypothetical protein CU100_14505 [Phyllobacterium endophyticum]TYR44414.1 hypothetical protein FY050_04655 [Phyllobacterium endophyticum]
MPHTDEPDYVRNGIEGTRELGKKYLISVIICALLLAPALLMERSMSGPGSANSAEMTTSHCS